MMVLPWEVLEVWNELQHLEGHIVLEWNILGTMDEELILRYMELEEQYERMKA